MHSRRDPLRDVKISRFSVERTTTDGDWCRGRSRLPFIALISAPKFQSSLTACSSTAARAEYGSESSIVSEPRTLGGLVLPLWGILTPQLPSVAQRPYEAARDFKYSSRVHRPSKYPAAVGNQLLLFRLYYNLPLLSHATKRHFGRISSRAFRFHSFVRRAVYPPSFQALLSNY